MLIMSSFDGEGVSLNAPSVARAKELFSDVVRALDNCLALYLKLESEFVHNTEESNADSDAVPSQSKLVKELFPSLSQPVEWIAELTAGLHPSIPAPQNDLDAAPARNDLTSAPAACDHPASSPVPAPKVVDSSPVPDAQAPAPIPDHKKDLVAVTKTAGAKDLFEYFDPIVSENRQVSVPRLKQDLGEFFERIVKEVVQYLEQDSPPISDAETRQFVQNYRLVLEKSLIEILTSLLHNILPSAGAGQSVNGLSLERSRDLLSSVSDVLDHNLAYYQAALQQFVGGKEVEQPLATFRAPACVQELFPSLCSPGIWLLELTDIACSRDLVAHQP
jgi:hypothetical protein